MPYRVEPYRSELTGTIAELMMAPGRAQAAGLRSVADLQAWAAQMKGATSANLAAQLGGLAQGTIGDILREREQAPIRAAQQEMMGYQLAEARDAEGQRQAARQRQPDIAELLKRAKVRDPETGVMRYDRNALMQGFDAMGEPQLFAQYAPLLDEGDKAVAAAKAAQEAAVKAIARRVSQAGYIPEHFLSELDMAVENGLVSDRDATPLRLLAAERPQQIQQVVDGLLGVKAEVIQHDPTKNLTRIPPSGAPEVLVPGVPDQPKVPNSQGVEFLLDGRRVKGDYIPGTNGAAGRYMYMGQDVSGRAQGIPPASQGTSGGTPYFTYQPTYDAQGRPTGAIRFDARGGPPQFVDVSQLAGGSQIKPPPGTTGAQTIANDAAEDQLDRLMTMFAEGAKDLVGPLEGRARVTGQKIPGVPVNQVFAEFDAASSAFRNAVIKAITGAQMSEPEAKRIRQQIPEVTDKPEVWQAKAEQTKKNLQDLKNRVQRARGAAPSKNNDPLGIR